MRCVLPDVNPYDRRWKSNPFADNPLRDLNKVSLACTLKGNKLGNIKKKNILLFSPMRGENLMLPISLLPIATALIANSYDVRILDVQMMGRDWEKRFIGEIQVADALGITCITGEQLKTAIKACKMAREHKPDIHIIWGGYHASLFGEELIEGGFADYVVIGPGEYVIAEVVDGIFESSRTANGSHKRIIKCEKWHKKGYGPLLDVLTYDLLDVSRYKKQGLKHINYVSSYGCLGVCTYCVENQHSGGKWIGIDPEKIVNDMEILRKKYNMNEIAFNDPDIGWNTDRFIEIVQLLSGINERFKIRCGFRADNLIRLARKMPLRKLKKNGIRYIYIGVESGSDRILNKLKKQITAEMVWEACQLLDKENIYAYTSFMHGFPGETKKDVNLTIKLCRKLASLKYNRQFHHFFLPYPKTQITRDIIARGGRCDSIDYRNSSTFHHQYIFTDENYRSRELALEKLCKLQAEYPESFSIHSLPRLNN